MKTIHYHRYGSPDVLQCMEAERPTAGDHQVLIRVHAASINALDSHLRAADIFLVRLGAGGLLKPKDPRIGVDLAGQVEAVGSQVTRFHPGDEVFGSGIGAFAEYAVANEEALVIKPPTLSFEAAAAVPVAALTALQGLRDHGKIHPGQKVLIQGASGGVGTFAVQIAKSFGAEVTGVCSTRNLDLVRSLGADQVIDYTREDFTRKKQRYDLILAINGFHPIFAYRRVLSPTGIYIFVGASTAHLLQALLQTMLFGAWLSRAGGQKLGTMGSAKINSEDLTFIKDLLVQGKIVPVIDKQYPLGEVAQAFRYFEDVHAQGKVVITIE